MDWLGIGVLLIGIAFLVLVFFLMKPLNKLAIVLENVQRTTEQLPTTLTEISGQATTILHTSNETIGNVNDQIKKVNPLLCIVEDVGVSARGLSSAVLDKTMTLKANTAQANEFSQREKYKGIYGLLSFLYFFSQNKNKLQQSIKNTKK